VPFKPDPFFVGPLYSVSVCYSTPAEDLRGYLPIQEALAISQEAGFSRAELLAYQDVLYAIRTETAYVGEKVAEAEARGIVMKN
jgi:hypothetical protein